MEDNNSDPNDDTSDDESFPNFDETDSRDGDPFSQIDTRAEGDEAPNWTEAKEVSSLSEPLDDGDTDTASSASSTDGLADSPEEVTSPSDISVNDETLGEVPSYDDPFEGDSPFQEVDTETIDEEALWEDIQSDEPDSAANPADAIEETVDEVVVSKSRFCQQCEYFADPPDIGCTHDGTEIVKFVGVDDVRLKDCPVVVEERELGHGID